MQVDFMIIGAQKCATTTLFDILNSHEVLSGCRTKEPHFFSTSDDWRSELDRYHGLFDQQEGKLYFEGSTTYTFAPHRNPNLWEDLYTYNPTLKFIYMVRNPQQRLVSAYMHAYERGYTDTDIVTALQKEPYFMDVTRYGKQIRPYVEQFGAGQVLVIDFDDFNASRSKVMESVAAFLEIDPNGFQAFDDTRSNVSLGGNKAHIAFDRPRWWHGVMERRLPWLWRRMTDNSARAFSEKPELPEQMLSALIEELESDIAYMEKILGKDLSNWRAIKPPSAAS